nr:hypothetical protein CFP56_61402 [Quercus suber]
MTSTENSTSPITTNSSYFTGQASVGMEDPSLNPFFLSSSDVQANNVYTSHPPSNSSSNGGSSSTPSAPLVPVVNDRASSFSMSYYTSSM